ncbi:MAG: hypothetical protein DMF06_04040 [Verrucomicrobia bacterium]|nr:MAG: hypothetical protein DMF06_04040 [Verrucomicrobiota bacterium]
MKIQLKSVLPFAVIALVFAALGFGAIHSSSAGEPSPAPDANKKENPEAMASPTPTPPPKG